MGEVKLIAQGYTTSKWQSWDSNPDTPAPKKEKKKIPPLTHESLLSAKGTIPCSLIQLCLPCDWASISPSVAASGFSRVESLPVSPHSNRSWLEGSMARNAWCPPGLWGPCPTTPWLKFQLQAGAYIHETGPHSAPHLIWAAVPSEPSSEAGQRAQLLGISEVDLSCQGCGERHCEQCH